MAVHQLSLPAQALQAIDVDLDLIWLLQHSLQLRASNHEIALCGRDSYIFAIVSAVRSMLYDCSLRVRHFMSLYICIE